MLDPRIVPELKRKMFHSLSIVFPLAYLFLHKLPMVVILIVITSLTAYVDITRHYNVTVRELVEKLFAQIMRNKERSGNFKLSGASYMMAGFLCSALFFSKALAIASWMVLIFADSAAAIFGQYFGTPNKYGKSIEGSTAFFLAAVMVGTLSHSIVYYHGNFLCILLASAAAAAVEYFANLIAIDDNFTIPVTFCLVAFISSLVF